GTPRLLLNSTAVRTHGISNDHDMVGRYLSTHPKADMGALILHHRMGTRHPLFTDRVIAGGVTRQGLGLSAAYQRQHRLLNHYVQLLPLLEHKANRLFERIKGTNSVKAPLVDRAPLIRGMLPGLGLLAFEAMGRLGGAQRRASKFILRGFLDQFPDPGNRVTLAPEPGAALPRVDIRWRFSDADRASVLSFFDALDADIRARDLGHIEYGPLRALPEWPLIGLHSHYLGTTRMGTDPATSVTTPDARVHGSENLYVAGPSLFPTYGFANPVYTIVALSLRLADHLKEQLQ
ncbi:MAG TPA: GMC family oxidoreductase, partial [Candidatus Krumholzibacteria bacterium]|nr:GMC family oxidoreductase [Candidatus Krumholzibacteria bacterium]